MSQKLLLKTHEAAAFLGVSVSSLEKWRALGVGPAFQRLGPRTIRYHVGELAAFQTDNTVMASR